MNVQQPAHSDQAAISNQLQNDGAVLCRGCPTDETWFRSFAERLGSAASDIDPELIGPTVMRLRYDPDKVANTSRPAYFSAGAFPLHTDLSFVPRPPRHLLMLCVTADPAGGGATLLSDCAAAWGETPEAERAILSSPNFQFRNPPNTSADLRTSQPLPIHFQENGRSCWRFRSDGTSCSDEHLNIIDSFEERLTKNAAQIQLTSGDLVLIDNHRVAHGRLAFDPNPSTGSSREILRTYAFDQANLTPSSTA